MPDVATIISCTSAVALGQLFLNMIFILRSSINISISDSTGAAMSGLLSFSPALPYPGPRLAKV